MPKKRYVDTEQVNLRLPIGLYEEVLLIMGKERRWNSPQQFIQDLIVEKIEKWKNENKRSK